MFLTENGKQVFLPGFGEQGSFLFAIYKVIIYNFVQNVTYVTLTSKNTPH